MILEYQCKNFKSIGDAITFSMVASHDRELQENIIRINGKSFLKEAVIYGGNGTGKSNFIKSLSYLKQLITTSVMMQPGQSIFTYPNIKMAKETTEFQVQFISNDVRYLYGVSFISSMIKEEFLYYYPNDRITKIFDRKETEITYGESFKKTLANVSNNFMKSNNLLFSCAANYSNIPEITNAFLFFSKDLVFYSELSEPNWNLYSAQTAGSNERLKKSFLLFLKRIGMNNIEDIEAGVEEVVPNNVQLPPFISDDFKRNILQNKILTPKIKFNYDGYQLDISDESQGIQKLFALFFPFFDIIENGKTFICDEFETHLHPLIVRELIRFFKVNSLNSQFIFTTHDVNLLDLGLFRRDQIWFTELNDKSFTEIYSLAELNNVRKNENISKNYLLGKYYGIPIINKDVESKLSKAVNE